MAETYVSKVFVNGEGIDLTADTAKEAQVLAGYTFHKSNGEPTTGTCTFDSNTQDASAEVAEVLSGETFYARGAKQTGTMPRVGKQTSTISDVDDAIPISQGYHDGSGTVTIAATEAAKLKNHANIKAGITILGETGTYGGEEIKATSKDVTPTFSEQTILPGTGYDYLSQVKVAPIPVTKTLNASGGYTITVG